jgi:hypothetical protein
VSSRLDFGGGGKLELQDAQGRQVATLHFGVPAFASPVDGVAVANPITGDPSASGGVAAQAVALDGNGAEVFRCSVTATDGGGSIEVNSVTVAATQEVQSTTLSYAAPS